MGRKGHHSTGKGYPGITGLPPRSSHRQAFGTRCQLVSSWELKVGPKGLGCSPIKEVRELEFRVIIETVRSLSRYGRWKFERLSLVREDRDGHTSGVPVVLPRA